MCFHFQKHQIWCPSPLGWNRVNCLAKQNGLGLKHGQQFLISFWFLLLVSSQQHFEFGVQAPLVEIGLAVWQKMGGRAKAWSTISNIWNFENKSTFWKWKSILKMKACFEHQFQNAVGWRLKVEIKRIYEIADHALAPPQFFCQTVSSISTKGAWTPNLMFWKWNHI